MHLVWKNKAKDYSFTLLANIFKLKNIPFIFRFLCSDIKVNTPPSRNSRLRESELSSLTPNKPGSSHELCQYNVNFALWNRKTCYPEVFLVVLTGFHCKSQSSSIHPPTLEQIFFLPKQIIMLPKCFQFVPSSRIGSSGGHKICSKRMLCVFWVNV